MASYKNSAYDPNVPNQKRVDDITEALDGPRQE